MDEFKTYHPIVNFTFFTVAIIFSMYFMHPVFLAISLLSSAFYSIMLNGKKAVRFNFTFMLPMLFITVLINPAFNHAGVTILSYFPSGNPLTLESVIYAAAAWAMMASVISWFSCFNKIMTSDKFIYLFGKIMPSLSLILSMTLRFVPRFKAQFAEIAFAQKAIGRDFSSGSIVLRIRRALTILSIMITWSLENAIETSDSMKSRGFGLPGRSSFSIFNFDKRDRNTIIYMFILTGYVLTGCINGNTHFSYIPYISSVLLTPYSFSIYAAYGLLCTTPIIIEYMEDYKWKLSRRKI